MANFNVVINCVVLGTNISSRKQYILSASPDTFQPLQFQLEPSQLESLEQNIIAFLKQHIWVDDLELLPQIINIHSKYLDTPGSLNIIYASVVNHTPSINNAHWIEFNLLAEQPYSTFILEVIQKLQ
jgi:hypothetical protein